MKLLFILGNAKFVGGGEYSIFKFAEYLAKRGNEAIVFTHTKTPYTSSLANIKNLRIYCRGKIPVWFKGFGMVDRLWDKIYIKFRVEPFLRKEKDIDFVIGYHLRSTIKANKLAKKFKIPSATFVFETPEWMHSQLNERWLEEYKGRFRRLWLKAKEELKTADIVFPNSSLTRQENKKWLGRSIEEPIYPGIDSMSIDKVKNAKKENQVIYVGRLNAYKNIDILIRALSKIKNPPKLVICGGGEERENLIGLANKLKIKCEFKGVVNDEAKWKEIKKSLFMAFPSSFEGFGMPPMEALYCEIPCVCSNIPILKEIYENKVEYFRENDAEDLIKKIKFLLDNPGYCKKRGKEGKKFIKSKYSWEKSAEKIEKILRKYKNGSD